MKKVLMVLLVGLGLFCSCEKDVELPNAVAFNKVPETNIAEAQLGVEMYTYEDLLRVIANKQYKEDAIYDCYEKNGKTYYIMNRRENYPDNANQFVGMEGLRPFKRFYDGYYTCAGGYNISSTERYNYTFDEATQELKGIATWVDYAEVSNTLVYLSEEYFVLQMGTPWKKRSKELGATFSRVVYKQCLAPDFAVVTDTVDYRK